MSLFDKVVKAIESGREGQSVWAPLGFEKMGRYVSIVPRTYTIVGGNPGTGKTGFVDLAYVLNPFRWWYSEAGRKSGIKLKWIYFSMERSKNYKIAKWICQELYMQHRVLIDVPTLLGWGREGKVVNDALFKMVKDLEPLVNAWEKHIDIIDGTMNPTGVYKYVKEYALANGTIKDWTETDGSRTIARREYIPNDPNLITIIIQDHIGKSSGEKIGDRSWGPGTKPVIDKMSEYHSTEFRDFYGFTPVVISQFNRGIEDTMRRLKTAGTPLPSDFKGSSNMYEDADVAIALYNPYKLEDMDYGGYNIRAFNSDKGFNRFRAGTILKNSYGGDDVSVPFHFIGENGYMTELPPAKDIRDYSVYANPKSVIVT